MLKTANMNFYITVILGISMQFTSSLAIENEIGAVILDDMFDRIDKRSPKEPTMADHTKESLEKIMVKKHNELRKKESLENNAKFMYKMKYSQTLAEQSQKWAKKCLAAHSPGPHGENIMIVNGGGYPLARAIQVWYDERQNYTFEDDSCDKGAICGHYEQVVNAKSKDIGCAVQYCPKLYYPALKKTIENAYNLVCQYLPGRSPRPYEKGSMPCQYCEDKCVDCSLCDYSAEYIWLRKVIFSLTLKGALKDGTKAQFEKEMLLKHNDIRKEIGQDNTTYMYKLKYNQPLAQQAQKLADGCEMVSSAGSKGVNQWMVKQGNTLVTEAVVSWFKEKQYYSFDDWKCSSGKDCSSFLQLAYAKNKDVGCGVKFCPNLKDASKNKNYADSYFVVCQYAPGYKQGKPYDKGDKPCKFCEDDCDCSLCDQSFVCKDFHPLCPKLKDICIHKEPSQLCRKTCGLCPE